VDGTGDMSGGLVLLIQKKNAECRVYNAPLKKNPFPFTSSLAFISFTSPSNSGMLKEESRATLRVYKPSRLRNLKEPTHSQEPPKSDHFLSRKSKAESISASALVSVLCLCDYQKKESTLTSQLWRFSHPFLAPDPSMIAIEVKLNTNKAGYSTAKSGRSENNQR
jgi:hypothetical protein